MNNMDTSETYAKMRLRAIPDLGLGKPPDLIPNIEMRWITTLVFVDSKGDFYYSSKDEAYQLERQDQLQEMIAKNQSIEGLQTLCSMLYQFSISKAGHGITIIGSMEQLWLAFVMSERYQKIWNGTDWIKEADNG